MTKKKFSPKAEILLYIKVINLFFLGHTRMEVDSDHSLIEKEKKRERKRETKRTPFLQVMTSWF